MAQFRLLKRKGALSASGQVLAAVALTEEEEDALGCSAAVLLQLKAAGAVKTG
jgi:hypothetical protein